MKVLALFRRELQVGPRSPLLLWAIVLPVLITLLVRGFFGSLFQSEPRLGIVDEGNSAITAQVQRIDGIDVTIVDSAEELETMVLNNDLDAGLILQSGFDDAVRNGSRPELHFFISGESLASNRIILAVTTLDLIRSVAGQPAPVNVQVVPLGEAGYDLVTRLLPFIMIYAIIMGAAFIPAMSFVQERQDRTLEAVLATPATMTEILTTKGLFGVVLGVATGVFTLFLNSAFGQHPGAMMAGMVVAALMMAEVGLMLGLMSKNSDVLFALFKSIGILIIFPVIFPIFPSLPQWIAKLGPTYYFLQPMFDIAVENATLADVSGNLAIALGICVVLLPLIRRMGDRVAEKAAVMSG